VSSILPRMLLRMIMVERLPLTSSSMSKLNITNCWVSSATVVGLIPDTMSALLCTALSLAVASARRVSHHHRAVALMMVR